MVAKYMVIVSNGKPIYSKGKLLRSTETIDTICTMVLILPNQLAAQQSLWRQLQHENPSQ